MAKTQRLKLLTEIFDKAYLGTSEKKGAYEAFLSLENILVNDETEEAYLYISSKYGGRELLKLVTKTDFIYLLINLACAYSSLQAKDETLTNEPILENIKDTFDRNPLEALMKIKKDKEIQKSGLKLLAKYRYKENLKDKLDMVKDEKLEDFFETVLSQDK